MLVSRRTLLAGIPGAAALATLPAILSRPARAATINGIAVSNLGNPKCVTTNGVPTIRQGLYYSKLVGDNHKLGTTDPWRSFPAVVGTYSALISGGKNNSNGNPAVAAYKYVGLRNTLVFIWGSPDPGDILQLLNNDQPVGTIAGNEITGIFGYSAGLNLMFTTPEPFNQAKLVANNSTFEWANFLDQSCYQQ